MAVSSELHAGRGWGKPGFKADQGEARVAPQGFWPASMSLLAVPPSILAESYILLPHAPDLGDRIPGPSGRLRSPVPEGSCDGLAAGSGPELRSAHCSGPVSGP